MKIGVLGLGVVGNAVYTGFSELGHSMSFYDPAKDSKFEDVLETEICFICVPTPPNEEGFCDTTIVEESIQNLLNNNYQGIASYEDGKKSMEGADERVDLPVQERILELIEEGLSPEEVIMRGFSFEKVTEAIKNGA